MSQDGEKSRNNDRIIAAVAAVIMAVAAVLAAIPAFLGFLSGREDGRTAPTDAPRTPASSVPAAPTDVPSTPASSVPAAPTDVPNNPALVAARFGGEPSHWLKKTEEGQAVGDNGWIYRGGNQPLDFVVPEGCVVDTPTGRLKAGQHVHTTDLTIYWLPTGTPTRTGPGGLD